MHPFFVYGTLLSGFKNHATVLAPFCPRMVPGTLHGARLFHFERGYPGIYPGDGTVRGEVVWVDDYAAAEHALDRLEAYHGPGDPRNLYNREQCQVEIDGAAPVAAWVYWCLIDPTRADAVPVPSGDWRGFMLRTGREDAAEDWSDFSDHTE